MTTQSSEVEPLGRQTAEPRSRLALHRCDRFVARTMNWLYDHLRFLPGYEPVVVCDALQNRSEFPELEAWEMNPHSLVRRGWRKCFGDRPYPGDLWRMTRRHPCVLHSHFGYVATEDLALHRALEIPWCVGFYGADVYQLGLSPQWLHTYARVFERLSLALALGPAMAERIEKLGCPRSKIKVHALGVEVDALPYEPRVWRKDEPLKVLFAGTFREKKGIQFAIEGAAIAHKRGVNLRLHLVAEQMGKSGDLETKDAVFALIRRSGIEHLVTHQPLVPFAQLLELGLQSHVFLAPSVTAADGDSEGTPFVLQQMMATGMPAIATVHSDIPYLFGGLSPLLVPERDANSIADRLERYADDRELVRADGVAMRQRIASAFDVKVCAGRLKGLYDAVV